MQIKALVVLSAVAILGVSSTAMARGSGGGHGMSMHGHGHFDHRFRFFNRFNRNPFLFGSSWGWVPRFFFVPPPFSQKKFSKKTFLPRVILLGWGEADDSHSIASAECHRSDRGDV